MIGIKLKTGDLKRCATSNSACFPHLSLMFVRRLVSVCSLAEAQSYLDSVVILLLTVTEISAE